MGLKQLKHGNLMGICIYFLDKHGITYGTTYAVIKHGWKKMPFVSMTFPCRCQFMGDFHMDFPDFHDYGSEFKLSVNIRVHRNHPTILGI